MRYVCKVEPLNPSWHNSLHHEFCIVNSFSSTFLLIRLYSIMGGIFVLCTLTILILAWHYINSVICNVGKSPIPPLYVFVLPVCYAFYEDIYVVCTLLYI